MFDFKEKTYSFSNTLVLVPTPISDEVAISDITFSILSKAVFNNDLIVVEDHKPARRRWLSWGLPRESIDKFICYNEHTHKEVLPEAISQLKKGRNIFLMSDCGLPAFCDPGRGLVRACHENNFKVTSLPFDNSVVLALALSGKDHDEFIFHGFLPRETFKRQEKLKLIIQNNKTQIIMDTPYRLKKLLQELVNLGLSKKIFLAMNLNSSNEQLLYDTSQNCMKNLQDDKSEFILII